jgi:hypothetical protein
MDHQEILNELNYYRAQKLTEQLYAAGLIRFVEYDKLTALNRQSFSPIYADLLPKTLEKTFSKR